MDREVYAQLIEWKSRRDHKPLVVDGARQVGKTHIIKEFGDKEYANYAYVNLDKDNVAKAIFEPDHDIDRIIRTLSAHTNEDIKPADTLIIIDEIQESSSALGCLKYFKEDAPQYDVVVAGSLLGISIHQDQSFPVGMVEIVQMFPMSFHEFLAATGNEQLVKLLITGDWNIINTLSEKYIDLLRQYYYVGGMPEAVKTYIEEKGLQAVRKIQKDILAGYRKDFSKHAPKKEVPRIEMVWDSLPSHLAKENKKFIYGAVRKGSRAKDFEVSINWLKDAGLIYKVHRVSKVEMPLKFYEDFDVFKIFPLDVGLLGAMTDVPASQLLVGDNCFTEFKGAFTECYVNEQLARIQMPTYYFSGNDTEIEIDFAVQTENRVIPIEVKSEESVRSKSLKTYIDKNPALKGLRVSMKNYIDQGWMENIGLYAIEGFLRKA
jgi:predicted AAA+ superfamily ATPase